MKNTLFCTVDSSEEARRIVARLVGAGLGKEGIAVFSPDEARLHLLPHELQERTPLRTVPVSLVCGGLGGLMGAYLAMAFVAIPRLSQVMGMGPLGIVIASVLGGAATGWATALVMKWWMPSAGAKLHEEAVRRGKILIQVDADDDAQRTLANRIVAEADGAIIEQSSDYSH